MGLKRQMLRAANLAARTTFWQKRPTYFNGEWLWLCQLVLVIGLFNL